MAQKLKEIPPLKPPIRHIKVIPMKSPPVPKDGTKKTFG
jgi:hypothetical protein